MSLVPVLALGLSLARVFGGGDIAREKIISKISDFGAQLSASSTSDATAEMTQEFIDRIREFANQIFDQIGNISFNTLGGVGLIALLGMSITMLSQVEMSFNTIWGAPPRKLWRKCSDYITIIIIVPFLGIAASTIPIVSAVANTAGGGALEIIGGDFLSRLLSFAVVWLFTSAMFTVVLMFVPNTKVKFGAGLIGGIITAIFFLGWLKICTVLQVGVVKYSKLYGGLAALPISLAWAYMSWRIVLLGAELTFAVQHSATFFRDEGAEHAGARTKWHAAIAIAVDMAHRLDNGTGPFDVAEFSAKNGVSVRLVALVLEDMVRAGIAAPVTDVEGKFTLVKSPSTLFINDIIAAVVDSGTSPEALGMTALESVVSPAFLPAEKQIAQLLHNPISELANPECPPDSVDGSR